MPPNIFDTEEVVLETRERRRCTEENLQLDLERAVEIRSLSPDEESFWFDNLLQMEYDSFEKVLNDEERREENVSSARVVNPERSTAIHGVKAGE